MPLPNSLGPKSIWTFVRTIIAVPKELDGSINTELVFQCSLMAVKGTKAEASQLKIGSRLLLSLNQFEVFF